MLLLNCFLYWRWAVEWGFLSCGHDVRFRWALAFDIVEIDNDLAALVVIDCVLLNNHIYYKLMMLSGLTFWTRFFIVHIGVMCIHWWKLCSIPIWRLLRRFMVLRLPAMTIHLTCLSWGWVIVGLRSRWTVLECFRALIIHLGNSNLILFMLVILHDTFCLEDFFLISLKIGLSYIPAKTHSKALSEKF